MKRSYFSFLRIGDEDRVQLRDFLMGKQTIGTSQNEISPSSEENEDDEKKIE